MTDFKNLIDDMLAADCDWNASEKAKDAEKEAVYRAARKALDDGIASLRADTLTECERVKVTLRGMGGRSDDYLTGFQDACGAYIDAIRALKA